MGSTKWFKASRTQLVVGTMSVVALAMVSGCVFTTAGSADPDPTTEPPPTTAESATTVGSAAATTAAPTTAPAATAAPSTSAATATSTGAATTITEPTTVATPPEQIARPTTPAVAPTGDWANFTYRVDCLGASGPVTLVNGQQEANEQNSWIWASLESVHDAGGGSTIVLLSCEASAQVNGLHAVLIGADGDVDDDLDIGPVESIDGLSYLTPAPEGWEPVRNPFEAASVQLQTLSASGGQLVVENGAVIPKCAPMGIDLPSLGRPAVWQGNLVREFQRRLIELGYGEPINATGGADGYMGTGTIQAFNQYFGDNWDYTDFNSPAGWYGDYESGEPIPYWFDIGWTEVLDMNCVGTYDPGVPE